MIEKLTDVDKKESWEWEELCIFANMKCKCCPRECGVDRSEREGFCGASERVEVAAICRHLGEEPPLRGERGICNVFFAHCNMRCLFCQNQEISRGKIAEEKVRYRGVDEVVEGIAKMLPECENVVGFVSATQYAYAIPQIVEGLHERGLFPTTVYNSNGYESVETLREIEPYIDVYLPDMKYMDKDLGWRYSGTKEYPRVAGAAIEEMVRQKGSRLMCDERGLAFRGVVIRHLVLPGQTENSKRVIDWVAERLPWNTQLSLMAQYYPVGENLPDELGRKLSRDEYDEVVEYMDGKGLANGWVQEMEASETYRPDFGKNQVFSLREVR